eukprot:1195632-Pyramimonas_sp.AAC.1
MCRASGAGRNLVKREVIRIRDAVETKRALATAGGDDAHVALNLLDVECACHQRRLVSHSTSKA